MKCEKCPYYKSSINFNKCNLLDIECFIKRDNCKFVDEHGVINKTELNKIN